MTPEQIAVVSVGAILVGLIVMGSIGAWLIWRGASWLEQRTRGWDKLICRVRGHRFVKDYRKGRTECDRCCVVLRYWGA